LISFILAGCGRGAKPTCESASITPGHEELATPDLMEKIEPTFDELRVATDLAEIDGTWETVGGRLIQINPDGTHQYGLSARDLERRLNRETDGKSWFEGARYYQSSKTCEVKDGVTDPGVYEIHIMPYGSLRFILVKDECRWRRNWLTGTERLLDDYLWARVQDDLLIASEITKKL
jgi:hypothetical protein